MRKKIPGIRRSGNSRLNPNRTVFQ